ncbi:MAG: hypothetical protein M1831_005675 [Alyxoria varia]|nr:MAG: hypothetical protein M1831_005675 [Alyxoria varia]
MPSNLFAQFIEAYLLFLLAFVVSPLAVILAGGTATDFGINLLLWILTLGPLGIAGFLHAAFIIVKNHQTHDYTSGRPIIPRRSKRGIVYNTNVYYEEKGSAQPQPQPVSKGSAVQQPVPQPTTPVQPVTESPPPSPKTTPQQVAVQDPKQPPVTDPSVSTTDHAAVAQEKADAANKAAAAAEAKTAAEQQKAAAAQDAKEKAEKDKAAAERDKAVAEKDKAQAIQDAKAAASDPKNLSEQEKAKLAQDAKKVEADKAVSDQDKKIAEQDAKASEAEEKAAADRGKEADDQKKVAEAEQKKAAAEQAKASAEASKSSIQPPSTSPPPTPSTPSQPAPTQPDPSQSPSIGPTPSQPPSNPPPAPPASQLQPNLSTKVIKMRRRQQSTDQGKANVGGEYPPRKSSYGGLNLTSDEAGYSAKAEGSGYYQSKQHRPSNAPFTSQDPEQKQRRRHSEAPPTSSVYTETPDLSRSPDHEATVAPLFTNDASMAQKPPRKSSLPFAGRSSAVPAFRKNSASQDEGNMNAGKKFAAKAAKAGAAGLGIVSSARTPWKGASGRTNLMSPIKDKLGSPSLAPEDAEYEEPTTRYLTVKRGKVSPVDEADRERSPSPQFSDDDHYKPPVPLKSRKPVHQGRSNSPVSTKRHTGNDRPPMVDLDHNAIANDTLEKLNADMNAHNLNDFSVPASRFSWTTGPTETEIPSTPPESRSADAQAISPWKNAGDRQPPTSRFSWSTRATEDPGSAGRQDSKAPSAYDHIQDQTFFRQASLPSPPPSPASPIITRRRPVPGANASVTSIKRKPIPSESETDATPSKDLPLAPPELASVDIISSLDAQLQELGHRRINLQKLIQRLTALQPQNPVVQDLARRRADRKKIEDLESQLAGVRSREHEMGLRLHRALKKRDQEEPTGLWVRRVTG